MDSSVSPTHGEQEGTAYNGHFGCTCLFPVSAYGTNSGDFVTEGFWPIVVTEGNEDETETHEFDDGC